VIYPSLITNGAAMIREDSPENVTLGELTKVLGEKYKDALTLDDSNSWSASRGKLLDADGNVVASLKEELDNADLNNMTPLQAFDLLRSMKEQLGI
jgi:hypothetical protein